MIFWLTGSFLCNPLALLDIPLFVYFISSMKYFHIISYKKKEKKKKKRKEVPSHCINLEWSFIIGFVITRLLNLDYLETLLHACEKDP